MAYIDWTPEMSMGMEDIDEQHKHFVGIINKTKEASDAGAARGAQKEVLGDLVEYARYHFETEEGYFETFSYPHTAEHKIEHAKLLANVLAFSDRFDKGEDVAQELLAFLKDWLADHLMRHDKKYSKYFKSKGYI
jgi:hemerythrin